MHKLGGLSKVVLGAITLALSSSLWAASDLSANKVDKQQQIKEFKKKSVEVGYVHRAVNAVNYRRHQQHLKHKWAIMFKSKATVRRGAAARLR